MVSLLSALQAFNLRHNIPTLHLFAEKYWIPKDFLMHLLNRITFGGEKPTGISVYIT